MGAVGSSEHETATSRSSRFVALPGVRTAAPYPLAVVDAGRLATLGLGWPSQALIVSDGASCPAWLYSTEQFPQSLPPDWPVGQSALWLSPRALRVLDVAAGDAVRLDTPVAHGMTTLSALVDDMPASDEVQVAQDVEKALTADGNPYALAVWNGWCAPVRVAGRDIDASTVRMSMATRTLIAGSPAGQGDPSTISLAPLWPVPSIGPARPGRRTGDGPISWRRRAHRVGWPRRMIHVLESSAEMLLGAPRLALRTSEAAVGDDEQQIVRLSSDLLALLGLSAGDQVIVGWADRQVVGVALPPVRDRSGSSLAVLQRVEPIATPADPLDNPAAHLTAGIAASIRAELGIPRRTVVTIKRRLLPRIAGRANELILPLGGLIVAALAIRGFQIVWVGFGSLMILSLSVLPLRHHRPPRGRWR